MIGKIFAHFLGSTDDDFPTDDNETYEELIEFEEGGWVVINIQGKPINMFPESWNHKLVVKLVWALLSAVTCFVNGSIVVIWIVDLMVTIRGVFPLWSRFSKFVVSCFQRTTPWPRLRKTLWRTCWLSIPVCLYTRSDTRPAMRKTQMKRMLLPGQFSSRRYIYFSQCDNTTIILEKGVSHFTVILSFPPRRPVPVKQHVSWRLAAWGSPLPCNVQLLAIQRARTHVECKKLTRSALQRQNLAKVRFSPSDRRFGHFKQPCQRLYNYWVSTE